MTKSITVILKDKPCNYYKAVNDLIMIPIHTMVIIIMTVRVVGISFNINRQPKKKKIKIIYLHHYKVLQVKQENNLQK